MHVEIIAVLDAPDELIQLVLKVLATLGGHHEVVLEDDGHTVSDHVAGELPLGLRERTSRRLVRHARRHALIELPDIPRELPIRVLLVQVREDPGGEGGVGGVGDETIDPIRQPGVGPLEDIGQMPAPMALEALEISLDVPRGRTEDVLVVLDGWLARRTIVRVAAIHPGVELG